MKTIIVIYSPLLFLWSYLVSYFRFLIKSDKKHTNKTSKVSYKFSVFKYFEYFLNIIFQIWQTCSSKLKLTERNMAESSSNFTTRMFPRLPLTSELWLLVRKVSVTRAAPSTELSLTSCSKEVTSQTSTALEEDLFTVRNSLMRTSSTSTPRKDSCQWPMLVRTPTDLSSSSPLSPVTGSMESTSSSEKSSRAWMSSRKSRSLEAATEPPRVKSLSLTAEPFDCLSH